MCNNEQDLEERAFIVFIAHKRRRLLVTFLKKYINYTRLLASRLPSGVHHALGFVCRRVIPKRVIVSIVYVKCNCHALTVLAE